MSTNIRAEDDGEVYAGTPIAGLTPATEPLRFAPPIRPGSWVRQTIHLDIARVGYPRDHKFYLELVRRDPDILAALDLVMETITAKLDKPAERHIGRGVHRDIQIPHVRGGGIIQGAARQAGDLDGLGGGKRRIFWYPVEPSNEPLLVRETSSVVEGDYYPPSGGGEDYDDGGLSNTRHWRLLHLDTGKTVREHVEAIPGGGVGDRWKGPDSEEWLVDGLFLRRRYEPTRQKPITILWGPEWVEANSGEWGAKGWTRIGPATERTARLARSWNNGHY